MERLTRGLKLRAYHEVLISNLSVSKQLKEKCRYYHVEIMYAYGSRCREAARYINGIGFIDKNGLSDMDIGIKTFEGCYLSVRDKKFTRGQTYRFDP